MGESLGLLTCEKHIPTLSAVKSSGKLVRGVRFKTQEGEVRSICNDMKVVLKSVYILLSIIKISSFIYLFHYVFPLISIF